MDPVTRYSLGPMLCFSQGWRNLVQALMLLE